METGVPGENLLDPRLTDLGYHSMRHLRAALAAEAGPLRGWRVLDVGCGAKPYRPLFAGPYVGLDYTTAHGRPDISAAGEHLPVRSASVDIVLSTQNLEHVEDPALVLTEARRVLRPGGRLLLSTHGVWVHHPDPHDYWRWTEEGLRKLIEAHGFEVERVHHLTELFLTGLMLAAYPAGAATAARRPLVRLPAMALVIVVNLVGFLLERLARALPRHYASVAYLVVARTTGAPGAPVAATSVTGTLNR